MSAAYYTAYDCVQASMPDLFVDIYRLVSWEWAFHIWPSGSRCGGWRIAYGQILEMDYRIAAEQIGFTILKVSGEGITEFPTEMARDKIRTLPNHPSILFC